MLVSIFNHKKGCLELTAKRGVKNPQRKKQRKKATRKASVKKKKKSTKRREVQKKKAFNKKEKAPKEGKKTLIDQYDFFSSKMPITIHIFRTPDDYVPLYDVSIAAVSETTEALLEQIRKRLINEVNLGMVDIADVKQTGIVEKRFNETIALLIKKYFPDTNEDTKEFLTTYLVQKSLGMGNVEILMDDNNLEEITINRSGEPVWVYHREHGWLKTSIVLSSEDVTKHYSQLVARRVGKQISILKPLLDAHLEEGDRVNATLMPITSHGNTMTIRRFSRDPFTITHFLKSNTLSVEAASLVWLCMQYEMSILIAGGTASGKTSTLNVLASFFPPNQRIISIEDTREIQLPKFLHWVPMATRLASAEKTGEISMGDLLVNSLRMRPDRILVGEVRRKEEANTLLEAIHTGHSCYATFHADNVDEAINRLTNPPIDIPKAMLPAISMVVALFRNRRTGKRRAFQIAEILPSAEANVLMQYDAKRDTLVNTSKSKSLFSTLQLYTGNTKQELEKIMKIKQEVLQYLVKQNIDTVDGVGKVMAEYYTNFDNLMKHVRANKRLG